jgi:hypothetical protein
MEMTPYGPFDVPHRVKMGLNVLTPDEPWIEVDDDYERDLREKRRLLATERARVLGVLPGSEPAQCEVRELVAQQIREQHPALVRVQIDDESDCDIERAARLVQEDLCIMERSDAGWCLTAAAVCFPTRWDMPSKLGLPLATIHDPVPGYSGRVAASADRFFDVLVPGPVFRRANWSLLDDPALFQPVARRGGGPSDAVGAHNAGDAVWFRTERQTLQRLPATGAILFTIRIHRAPLRVLARDPATAAAFAASVRSIDADLARYKALGVVRDAALAYLDAASAPDTSR